MIALLALQLATTTPQQPIAHSTRFDFYSSFWQNLHHMLYVESRARRGFDAGRPVVQQVLYDTAGWGALSDQERTAWRNALAYYDRELARKNAVFDSVLVQAKIELIEVDTRGTFAGATLDSGLIRALRTAEPVYRKLWWPRHDAANRAWIERAIPLLRQHGDTVAARIARAFRTSWPRARIRVDVAPYTNWSGADTTNRPSHIMATSQMPSEEIVELLYHESLHTLDRPLYRALQASAQRLGKRDGAVFIHPLIFYSAGAITAQSIPGHEPYAEKHGLWQRPGFAEYRAAVYRYWQPYLEGKITFEEAVDRLVGTLEAGAAPQAQHEARTARAFPRAVGDIRE
jgi:hypothetical protein